MNALIGIIFICIGLAMQISPKTFFEITEGWKSNNVREPSGLYITGTRIGGAIFLALGLACILIMFL